MYKLFNYLLAFVLLALASCALTRPQPPVETGQSVTTAHRSTKASAVDTSTAETTERVTTERSTPGGFYSATVDADSLERHGNVVVADPFGLAYVVVKDRQTGRITSHFFAPGGTSKTTAERHSSQQTRQSAQSETTASAKDSTATQRREPPVPAPRRSPVRWLIDTAYIAFDFGGAVLLAGLALASALALRPVFRWLAPWLRRVFFWFIGLFRRSEQRE
jgi:hypothetical protein